MRMLALFVTGIAGLGLHPHAAARAQTPAPPAARHITVQNLAPFARREWVSAVVPFARGIVDLAAVDKLRAGDGPTVWQAFGARWPDGSLRQAICLFPVEMQPLSEVLVPLQAGNDIALPPGTQIVDPLRSGAARLTIEVTLSSAAPGAGPGAAQGAAPSTAPAPATPQFVRLLEDNAARQVALYRCRVPGAGLVFEVQVAACAGQPHCYVDLALFFSDPTTRAMQLAVERVTVKCAGMRLLVRHARATGVSNDLRGDGAEVRLLAGAVLGDGQGIRRTGVLTPLTSGRTGLRLQTLQASALGPILAATSWRDARAYGPFGFVPDPPVWLHGKAGRAALARRHAEFVRSSDRDGDPFTDFGFGLAKNPGRTGSQHDFGILKLAPVASTGLPSFLLEIERATLQEACRPVHYFEADGSPLQVANHPQLVFWSGRPHWNCDVSPDRLGKPCPEPKHAANGWQGKDRQHWSSNYLCGYYLLTGSHWARREIDNEVQLFLGAQTVRPGLSTSGSGAARAAGRMLLLGCWLHQCTGSEALLARLHARMKQAYLPGWAGRDLAADKVRPMQINKPDGRILQGKTRYWSPWQESLAATGFFALWRHTGDEVAEQLAAAIATTVLRHGWRVGPRGAQVGYALRWNEDGSPLTAAQLAGDDPTVCTWAGGGIAAWSIGAVEVARYFATRDGDQAAWHRAEQILQLLRQGNTRPPRDGWWDAFREWDAVR